MPGPRRKPPRVRPSKSKRLAPLPSLEGELGMFKPEALYAQRFAKGLVSTSLGGDARAIGMPSPGPGTFGGADSVVLDATDRGKVQAHNNTSLFGVAGEAARIDPNDVFVRDGALVRYTGPRHEGTDHSGLTDEEKATMAQSSAGARRDLMRKTATLSSSQPLGPTAWLTGASATGLTGFASKAALERAPAPKYDTRTALTKGPRIAQDDRANYLARVMFAMEQRSSGNFNEDAAVPRGKLLSHASREGELFPSPADYVLEPSHRHVDRNTATHTALRMVPHMNGRRVKKVIRRVASAGQRERVARKAAAVPPEKVGRTLAAMQEMCQWSHMQFSELLGMYDADDSGALSAAELCSAFTDLKLDVADSDVRALVHYFDKDGDEEIGLQELKQAMRSFRDDPRLSAALPSKKPYRLGQLPDGALASSTIAPKAMPAYLRDNWATPEIMRARENMWRRRYGRKPAPVRLGAGGAATATARPTIYMVTSASPAASGLGAPKSRPGSRERRR